MVINNFALFSQIVSVSYCLKKQIVNTFKDIYQLLQQLRKYCDKPQEVLEVQQYTTLIVQYLYSLFFEAGQGITFKNARDPGQQFRCHSLINMQFSSQRKQLIYFPHSSIIYNFIYFVYILQVRITEQWGIVANVTYIICYAEELKYIPVNFLVQL